MEAYRSYYPEAYRAIAAAIPDSRLAILPGDHFVARRNWQTFNPLVLDFLLDGAQTP